MLASLYAQLGQVHHNRLDRGEFADYPTELAKAIEYFEKAIELQTELELPLDLATSLNNLALLYESQGRYSEAEPLYLRALEIWERQLGADHPAVAISLSNLGLLYVNLERYAEVESLYVRALQIFQARFDDQHPYTQETIRRFTAFLRQTIAANRTAELSNHPLTQNLLQQLQTEAE
ncbi:MAG: tetratricopeptide repeat protein [Leptolyngbya sp. IPPAS B-1204]